MAGGLTVSVRQIASYPVATISPNDLVLVQQGGLGGPYATATAYNFVNDALLDAGPLGIGVGAVPADAATTQVFVGNHVMQPGGALLFNAYFDTTAYKSWSGGSGGLFSGGQGGFSWEQGSSGSPGQPVSFTPVMTLSPAGALSLPRGTLAVARDPASALEVATMGWVGASTVASFNGRRGVVTLDANDIGCALGYPVECIATVPQVNEIVCQTIQDLIRTYPAVWSWNGRVGDVWLTVDDINWAFTQAGIPPITQTPPSDSNDGSIPNTEWVNQRILEILAGPPAYATEPWVLQQIQANVGASVTAFNGRTGNVNLLTSDITFAGGAPINSPAFSGTPTALTAPPGTSSGQLATTAFVMAAVVAATTGVVSFNGREGVVTLDATDINDAGGALLASPNFTGTPTSTTPPTGDSSQRIATTAFVMAEVAAATAGVSSFNGRTGIVTLALADVTAAGGAPIASPGFSGIPTAPTAANGTNTTQLATTAFVQNELTAISAGVITWNGRSGVVVFTQNDLSAVGGLYNPNAQLTGTPTAPTQAPNNNSTAIATTAYVANAIQGAAVTSWNGRSGTVTLTAADLTGVGGALLASPTFTGVPAAPTQPAGNNSTALATTAFVQSALASYLPLSGGVLSGPLTLPGNATQPLQAVTLQQLTAAASGFLPLTGGTLAGPGNLTVSGLLTQGASGAQITILGSQNSNVGQITFPTGGSVRGWPGSGVALNTPAYALIIQDATNPPFTFNTTSSNLVNIDIAGNVNAVGAFNGAAVGVTGNITATSGSIQAGGNIIATPPNAFIVGSTIVGPSGSTLIGNVGIPSGQLTVSSSIQSGGNVIAGPPNAFICGSTIVGPSGSTLIGNVNISSNLGVGGGITAGGNIQGQQSIWAFGNNSNPGVTSWDQSVGRTGFFTGGGNVLYFATFGGDGSFAGIRGSIDGSGNMTIGGTLTQSDATTKENIQPITQGVSLAAQLLPKSFQRLPPPQPVGMPPISTVMPVQWGFVAQDVQPVIPTAVNESPSPSGGTGLLNLDVMAIVAVLANAVKQLLSRVAALEANANITPTAAETA